MSEPSRKSLGGNWQPTSISTFTTWVNDGTMENKAREQCGQKDGKNRLNWQMKVEKINNRD